MSINKIHLKHNIDCRKIKKILKNNNIEDNLTGRFCQPYILNDDYAEIRIRKGDGFVYCKIDLEDVNKCKSVGIWSISKAGYIVNCRSGIYIHRFVMNCPDGIEIDHIHHDPLDNRKSMLRFATSSEQKMNTKIRKDNTSGHRGVYYDKSRDTWNVNINLKDTSLRKRFKTYEEACSTADKFYEEHFKEFRFVK